MSYNKYLSHRYLPFDMNICVCSRSTTFHSLISPTFVNSIFSHLCPCSLEMYMLMNMRYIASYPVFQYVIVHDYMLMENMAYDVNKLYENKHTQYTCSWCARRYRVITYSLFTIEIQIQYIFYLRISIGIFSDVKGYNYECSHYLNCHNSIISK